MRAKLRDDRTEARHPNETWAIDFIHDQLATGSEVRVLTVVDLFSAIHQCWIRVSVTAQNMACKR